MEEVIAEPSEERLEKRTKEQLVAVAEHYGAEISNLEEKNEGITVEGY